MVLDDDPTERPLLAVVSAEHLPAAAALASTPASSSASSPASTPASARTSEVELRVRVPGWARRVEAELVPAEGTPLPLPSPAAGAFLTATLSAGSSVRLRLWPRLEIRSVRKGSELHGLFHGGRARERRRHSRHVWDTLPPPSPLTSAAP